jgi:hypothetical protein
MTPRTGPRGEQHPHSCRSDKQLATRNGDLTASVRIGDPVSSIEESATWLLD